MLVTKSGGTEARVVSYGSFNVPTSEARLMFSRMFSRRTAATSTPPTPDGQHKRCFVISPIGSPKSEIREHADDVFEFIIEPATKRAGYFVHRGDHNTKPGKITEQMFESILEDDIIIAVLTFQNPNVYFELAVAQSAARPVILMIMHGEDLPFDIKDNRVIFYDLRPRPLFKGEYVDQLYRAIQEAQSVRDRQVPFAPSKSPLGAEGNLSGGLNLLARQNDYSTQDYISFLDSSNQFLLMSGISLQAWHKRINYGDILQRKIDSGCIVRVLLMDEGNLALPEMLNEYAPLEMVQREINDSYKRWKTLADKHSNVEVLTAKRGIVYQQITLSENGLIYTPYCFSVATGDSPTFEAMPGSPLYRVQKMEFERLWHANALTPISYTGTASDPKELGGQAAE